MRSFAETRWMVFFAGSRCVLLFAEARMPRCDVARLEMSLFTVADFAVGVRDGGVSGLVRDAAAFRT